MKFLKPTKHNLRAILNDHEALYHNAETYFAQNEPPYSPSGLALALGFSSFKQLKAAIINELRTITQNLPPETPPDFLLINPPPFLSIIDKALSFIEDDLFRNALIDEYRGTTVQYFLNAYFEMAPTAKQSIEQNTTSSSKIEIIMPDTNPSSPSHNEEVDRLKSLIDTPITHQQKVDSRPQNKLSKSDLDDPAALLETIDALSEII